MNTTRKSETLARVGLLHRSSRRGSLREVAVNPSRSPRKISDSKNLLQSFIDATPSPAAIIDPTRTITSVNRAWCDFFAQTGLELRNNGVGGKYPEIFEGASASSDSLKVLKEAVRRVVRGESSNREGVLRFRLFHDPIALFVNFASLKIPGAQEERVVLTTHDRLSSSKLATEVLRNYTEFLKLYFQTTKVVEWEAAGPRRMFTRVGENAQALLGFPALDWHEGGFWTSHLHPDDRQRVVRAYTKALSDGPDAHQLQYRMIGKDGRPVWIHDIIRVIRETGRPALCCGLMVDVTSQKHAELSTKMLTGRLISAQEKERRRIARELHDDLNQRIAVISIELEQLARSKSAEPVALRRQVRRIQKNVEEIGTEIHLISHQLHPSKLDHLGLMPAIRGLCSETAGARGLSIEFAHDDVPNKLPKDLTLCMFRVAQEALQNASKHSHGSRVDVHLSSSHDAIKLLVADNGDGFTVTSEKMTTGLGFTSMEERLRSIDGELRVTSTPGHGTAVEATAPLSSIRGYEH